VRRSGFAVAFMLACLFFDIGEPVAATKGGQDTATVVFVSPKAVRYDHGKGRPKDLQVGEFIHTGDRLKTDEDGKVRMVLVDGSDFELWHGSDVEMVNLDESGAGGSELALQAGTLRADVKKLADGKILLIRTGSEIAAVRGTQYQLSTDRSRTELQVLRGVVDLGSAAGGAAVSVSAGMKAVSVHGRVSTAVQMNRNEVERLRAAFRDMVAEDRQAYRQRVDDLRRRR